MVSYVEHNNIVMWGWVCLWLGYVGIFMYYFVHYCLSRGKTYVCRDACVDGPPAARRWRAATDDQRPKPPPP